MEDKKEINKATKWTFSDYAFTLTGIVVAVLLLGPELLEELFDITLWGGSLSDMDLEIEDAIQAGGVRSLYQLRALSPMLFLITLSVIFIKDAFDARKTGGYTDSLFNHTFETLLEDAIYMTVMTIMVFSAILANAMYISWLAGPITWLLFIFLFPLLRRKDSEAKLNVPWVMLLVFVLGIVFEVAIGGWVFFPLSWLILCVMKLRGAIVLEEKSLDRIFNLSYYALSVILMGLGVMLGFWFASWVAFPVSFFICWVLKKTGKYQVEKSREL